MNEPRAHHFVPQFLLKRWTVSNGELVRFYRPFRDVVTTSSAPAGVGYRKDLYRLEGWPKQSVTAIESDYMSPVVDNPAAKALNALITPGQGGLTPDLREAWVRFLMSLPMRTPKMVDALAEKWNGLLPEIIAADPQDYEAVMGPNDPPTLFEWVEKHTPTLLERGGKHLLPRLIENSDAGTVMLRMSWSLVKLRQPFPDLLLGDNPLVRIHALKNPNCVIALPVAPNLLFIATHSREATQRLLERAGNGLARSMNESTVSQAERDVFGTTNRHLRFVENHLRKRDEIDA